MKRLALALMMAALAGGATTSLAFNGGMQGGGGFHGGGRGSAGAVRAVPGGGGFSGGQRAVVVRPGFPGNPGFVRPGFGRPGFVGPGFVRPGFGHTVVVRPGFPFRPGFPVRRFAVVGGPVFFGPPPVVFVSSGVPALWYCQNPIGYFPSLQDCPVGWIQVQ